MNQRMYLCIDLKSFYASAECVARGLDPLTTNLVVADPERSHTTVCLAITPAMKQLGIPNRCRVFEIPSHISYIMAPPRMRYYMELPADIYALYLNYVSPEDIYVYSIDECFIDATPYLELYRTTALDFARMLIQAVYDKTGIGATAGIGTNLFLAKVALDITAKHSPENIGILTEETFKRDIWFHRPLTDIWNIGPGIARRLAHYGIYDLADVAACSETILYREFGAQAEFLIDHAWGQEPCTIADIHAYQPKSHSITHGQILPHAYTREEALIVLHEMVYASVLDLTEQKLACSRIGLAVGYEKPSHSDLMNTPRAPLNQNPLLPPSSNRKDSALSSTGGERKLAHISQSIAFITQAFDQLFETTTHHNIPIKRINITLEGLHPESQITYSLFDNMPDKQRESSLQHAMLSVRKKFGKNSLLKGISLYESGTAQERNLQSEVTVHDNLSKYGDTAHHHATLEEIHRKLQQHGIHTARAYPQRARQFMPFAALKGYHELAHSKELIPQEKPTLAEDESSQLDSMLIRTKKGNALRVRYYHEGHLLVTEGIVKEIDLVFHTLYIKHTAIKFDDIVSLEELFEGPTQQCGQDEP